MLDHEESPEKPEYNMATSPFLDTLPSPPLTFALTPPPFFLPKSHPPLYEGGGVCVGGGRTMTGAAND